MLDKRLADGKPPTLNWATGQDVWDWWTKKPEKVLNNSKMFPIFE
jgi:hypothetical protein